MPLLDMNMNMNMNMNMAFAPSSAGGRWVKPRFNSDVESRLANVTIPDLLVPPIRAGGIAHDPDHPTYLPFHEYWDADLRACRYLEDFLAALAGGVALTAANNAIAAAPGSPQRAAALAAVASAGMAWRTDYANAIRNPGGYIPPDEMTRAELGGEVRQILELGLERESRFAEIIDQDDADGAINYWLGMLKIDPARHPATFLMVHVGRRIGEHVSMILKGIFMSPRPSQVSPWITPMIDPPVTPSFPAGHAIQSYLISFLLAYSFANTAGQINLPLVPQPFPSPTAPLPIFQLPAPNAPFATFFPPPANPQPSLGPLFDLANRVSENRIVAGIHYPVDIRAGRFVAYRIFQGIQTVPSIWGGPGWDGVGQPISLRNQVRGEFPQYIR